MRKTLLTAAAATMVWSQALAGVSFKAGYTNIAGEFRYHNMTQTAVTPFSTETTKTEDISVGVVSFGGDVMANVNDMFSIGFGVGASMSGDFEFDDSLQQTPLAPAVNQLSGDTTKYTFSKIPVLAKVAASFEAGPGTATLGLGVGAIIVAWTQEKTDQLWWDGVSWSPNSNKSAPTDKAFGKQIDTMTLASPIFAFEIAPAYHYKLNDKSSVGLEIPLQFVSETIINGGHIDVESSDPSGGPAYPDPYYGQNGPEVMIGGLEWGVNVVYTVKI